MGYTEHGMFFGKASGHWFQGRLSVGIRGYHKTQASRQYIYHFYLIANTTGLPHILPPPPPLISEPGCVFSSLPILRDDVGSCLLEKRYDPMVPNLPICIHPHEPTFPLSIRPTPHLLQTLLNLTHLFRFSHLLDHHPHWHTKIHLISHVLKRTSQLPPN